MMRDVLLVLAFLLGAGIMRVFVRIADHFIEHVVLPEDADIKCQMENEMRSAEDAPKKHTPVQMKSRGPHRQPTAKRPGKERISPPAW